MSQNSLVVPDSDGATFLANLNDALDTLATTSKGPSRPSTIGAGKMWIDDNSPSASVWSLNLYDGTDDILMGYIDTGANTFTPITATAAADTNTTQVATTAFVLGQSATQAQAEAASSALKFLSPARVHFHPAVAKAVVKFSAGVTPAILRGYNVGSITRSGAGDYDIHLTNPTSDTDSIIVGNCDTFGLFVVTSQTSTSVIRVRFPDTTGTLADPATATLAIYGDMP